MLTGRVAAVCFLFKTECTKDEFVNLGNLYLSPILAFQTSILAELVQLIVEVGSQNSLA